MPTMAFGARVTAEADGGVNHNTTGKPTLQRRLVAPEASRSLGIAESQLYGGDSQREKSYSPIWH